MDRRQFLNGIGTAGVLVTAGCSSPVSGPTALSSPTIENPERGRYYYNVAHEGDPVASVDVTIDTRSTPGERAGVVLSAGPESGSTSATFEFALRAPTPSPGEQPARIMVNVADTARYPLSLGVTDEGYRLLELDGLEAAGHGDATIPLQLAVVPHSATSSACSRLWRGRTVRGTPPGCTCPGPSGRTP